MRGVALLLASIPCDRRVLPTTGLGNCLIGLADPTIMTSRNCVGPSSRQDKTRRRSHLDNRSLAIDDFRRAIRTKIAPSTTYLGIHRRPKAAANVRAEAEP